MGNDIKWFACPACGNKHMFKYSDDTVLVKHIAYCRKCKQEITVDLNKDKIVPVSTVRLDVY